MLTTGEQLLACLTGSWKLSRSIAGTGQMLGMACFTGIGRGRMRYRERGRLQLRSGPTLSAQRVLEYRLAPSGIAIYRGPREQSAGELLFNLAIEERGELELPLAVHAAYDCGADRYLARFTFVSTESWRTEIAVEGPRKGYCIYTEYQRAPRESSMILTV